MPRSETVETVYDHLDFVHALNVYLNAFAGASTYALRKGFHEAGVDDNQILMFSELMDAESLFLTANADTVYFIGIVDLTSGPMVIETPPPQALHSRTTRAFLLGRSFMVDDDPAPTVEQIKRTLKLYPMPRAASGRAWPRCSRARCGPTRRLRSPRRFSWRAAARAWSRPLSLPGPPPLAPSAG